MRKYTKDRLLTLYKAIVRLANLNQKVIFKKLIKLFHSHKSNYFDRNKMADWKSVEMPCHQKILPMNECHYCAL